MSDRKNGYVSPHLSPGGKYFHWYRYSIDVIAPPGKRFCIPAHTVVRIAKSICNHACIHFVSFVIQPHNTPDSCLEMERKPGRAQAGLGL